MVSRLSSVSVSNSSFTGNGKHEADIGLLGGGRVNATVLCCILYSTVVEPRGGTGTLWIK